MFKTTLIAMTILACASLAAAQSDDYKKFELFAGYSHMRVNSSIAEDQILEEPERFHGFNTSFTGNVSRYVGFKFDYSAHFDNRTIGFGPITNGVKLDSRLHSFLGGVQIKDNSPDKTFKPFVHALVGAAHLRTSLNISNEVCIAIAPSPCTPEFTEKETGFAGAFGGGIDIRVSRRVDVRVIQVDYNPTRLFDSTQHNVRFGVGLVFH